LQPKIDKGLLLHFVTSSFSTFQLLLEKRLPVQPVAAFTTIDIYFDGCDQIDKNLNVLKSGGGIHTQEKLVASMAKEFIILGDEAKFVKSLSTRFPVVIEFLPQSFRYVPDQVQRVFPGTKTTCRTGDKKDGMVTTENGNYLLDVWFDEFPELSTINPQLKNITGVVETSLFYGMADKAIIAGKDGVKSLERKN
ncbi:MAG TPA: ribose 5-phosphate isomerase A, partial [Segetibacter sp.]